jgi:glycosyltransferase involved in cell wall biosynthesis
MNPLGSRPTRGGGAADASRPLFSVVTAVYNVAPYLPDFIASIDGQRFDLGRIQVIAVDDGSTDGSLALLEAWAGRSAGRVKVVTKPNGGQAAARNLGLEHATGEWVTFTDPDDMLDRNFFRTAAHIAATYPDLEVMASQPVLLDEDSGEISDHPRRRQYDGGNRPVNLDIEPNTFTGSASVSLFKLDRIRISGLRYDPRIRPNFEDGHFAVHYLMTLPQPVVGILRDARYIYRKRRTNNSTLQRSMRHPGRYSDVLRLGYLEVLERARAQYGFIPRWLQHVLIYELSWYLSEDEKIAANIRISAELIPEFHDLLCQIVAQLEPEVVQSHTVRKLKPVWVDILAYGCRGRDWHSPVAARTKVDAQMRLQRIAYRYVGKAPREEFLVDGAPVAPAYAKTMSHTYYRRTLISERVIWLPADRALQVRLDGVRVRIVDGWPNPRQRMGRASVRQRIEFYARLPQDYVARGVLRRLRNVVRVAIASPLRVMARGWPYENRFGDAWVVIDRIHDADDNAERLFEYLVDKRRDINAWFVLEKGTVDWNRMRAAGVRRLVAHGSFEWTMLMLNCSWLLSSHSDIPIVRPPGIMRLIRKPTWRFGFLQHGVIKDDLSLWLNHRDIDMFVVSTKPELESIVADGTSYEFTTKETRNTGLPRFDRLLEKGRQVALDERNLVLVAPTWRQWLTLPLSPASQRRAVDDGFWNSDYFRNWNALLTSPEIADAAARCGLRIGFMPHPNLQSVLAHMELPAHIEPLSFVGTDVQELYARCALLVTDYSSVAFNVAYLNRPVVYFQFDGDEMFGGAHVGRQGYFDYSRDGFGPVVMDAPGAVAAMVAAINSGPIVSPKYQARIDRTFVNRDGQACARVVDAVEELSRPYREPTPA